MSECVITYDGVPTYSISIMEFTDGLVTHETSTSPTRSTPPPRAGLAESMPADGD